MKRIDDLKSQQDVIIALKELCITMQKHKLLYTNSKANFEVIEKNKANIENFIENKLQELDSDESKILFLKSIIEYMFIEPNDLKLKEELVSVGEKYYKNILDKANQLTPKTSTQEQENSKYVSNRNETKEDEEEIRFLELIKKAKPKIYEDKEKTERFLYGELLENHRIGPEIIYDDKEMRFERKKTYETHKSTNSDKGSLSSLSTKKVCKYRFELIDDGKKAKVDFFADYEIGDVIAKGDFRYFSPMLAAILKAKDAGRNYIGTISMVDEDLETFVTRYDENLELAIKNLKEKEKIKQKPTLISNENKEIR